MTPLPKRKHSTRRTGKRKASQKISLPNLAACSNCGNLKNSHQVCSACGYYRGKPVIKIKPKKEPTK